MSDYAMPERPMAPEEQIWSNLMDPTAAAELLDEDPGARESLWRLSRVSRGVLPDGDLEHGVAGLL